MILSSIRTDRLDEKFPIFKKDESGQRFSQQETIKFMCQIS